MPEMSSGLLADSQFGFYPTGKKKTPNGFSAASGHNR